MVPLASRPSNGAEGVADLLIVEDDDGLRASLTRDLTASGHHVRQAAGVAAALVQLERPPQLVILDLTLPDGDGLDVLAGIRRHSATAVIVATGRDEEADIIALLDAGADDYLVKPYSFSQLEARIRAVLRRVTAAPDRHLTIGDLDIDLAARTVTLDRRPIDLSRKEFDLLAALAARAGEVVTKRELLAEVWRQPDGGADKTIDVHLSWLRRKLGETADEPSYLHTVRGVGVKLAAPP